MAAVRVVRLELHETSGPLEQWLDDLDRTAVNRLFRSTYTAARFESPWYLPCPMGVSRCRLRIWGAAVHVA